MRRSQQAFSVPSKQTQSSNAKDELSSTASINASSTTLIPSSKLLASKPRDCTLKREQNSCYEHDNGLNRVNMRGLEPDILQVIEPQVLNAVVQEAYRPDNVPLGELRKIEQFDEYGKVRELRFIGQESFVKQLADPAAASSA